LVSPASSPPLQPEGHSVSNLSEPDFLDLENVNGKARSASVARPSVSVLSTSVPKGTGGLGESL
jgi:hypothetical protein